ncbi:MAG TPA: hypothetical protein VJ689_01370 [Gaiellaceae bacterium]|jgi:hypothetical protein|nr:hypothetical protein [Gaiellaceae bacterium]
MIAGLDRDAIARVRRRAQAAEALDFERERERLLAEQIELLVLETEGARIDAEVFARLDPADVAVVREVLDGVAAEDVDEDPGAFVGDDGYIDLDAPDDDAGRVEEEIARLGEEIERSRATQATLERYLAALDAPQQ